MKKFYFISKDSRNLFLDTTVRSTDKHEHLPKWKIPIGLQKLH